MKNKILCLGLLVVVTLGNAWATDEPTYKPKIAGKPSMAVPGRFHSIHQKIEKLECDDCHDKQQSDILFLRKDDPLPAKMDKVGQADRKGCLTCHKPGEKNAKTRSFWGV